MADRDEWKYTAIGVGVVALIAFVFTYGGAQLALRFKDGTYLGAVVTSDSITIGETYSWSSGGEGSIGSRRLTRLALSTGAQLERRELRGLTACDHYGAQILVCDADGVVLIDQISLATTSRDWYGSDGLLGERFEDMPKVRRSDEQVFVRGRSGAWFSLEGADLKPADEPMESAVLDWPARLPKSERVNMQNLIDARRFVKPGWLVEHAVSLDPEDGRSLSTLNESTVKPAWLLPPQAIVLLVIEHQNDAVVVAYANAGVEVARITSSGAVVWQTRL